MFLKIFIFFLILIRLTPTESNNIEEFKHCLIHNVQYSHEYLYASKKQNVSDKIITTPLEKVDDFIKVTWIFIPVKIDGVQVNHLNRTLYMIKSGKYENDYLCTANQFEKISPSKRGQIKLSTIKDVNNKFNYYNCYWSFETINLNKTIEGFKEFEETFVIRNMLTNEPMYAASFFFNSGWNKRSVFLWSPKKSTISNKFKWFIDCSKGEFLYSK